MCFTLQTCHLFERRSSDEQDEDPMEIKLDGVVESDNLLIKGMDGQVLGHDGTGEFVIEFELFVTGSIPFCCLMFKQIQLRRGLV